MVMTPVQEVGMTRRIAGQMARALAVGLGFALMGIGASGQQVGKAPLEVRVPVAPQPAVALGRTHLVWEVHITNVGKDPIALDRLEVAGADQVAVGSWSDAQLRQRVMLVGASAPADPTAPTPLAPGKRAVAFLWVTLAPGQAVPTSLTHRLIVSADGGDPHVVDTAPVTVAADHHAPLGSPVRGGPWVAVRGPSAASGHRLSLVALDGVVRVPQRFAVDWVRLSDDGRLFRGEGAVVTDWFSYDLPALAVADATVVLTRDGMPDTTPRTAAPATIGATEAPGNVVVLDLGDGRFVTYAHLKAGTIVVTEGARVRAGQELGRIGNSGNSLGPHLHFHVSDAVEPLGGEGLPFAMRQLELVGRIPGLAPLLAGTPWTPQPNQPARTVTAEMPLENMVVKFEEE
jgi:hypothetical protein